LGKRATTTDRHSVPRQMRQALKTDAGMARFMDELIGPGNWHYEESEDLWVTSDRAYSGQGRGYICVRRGGSWFRSEIPEGEVH
jgi:uncharacterized protein YggL (DUF469 family)